MRRRVFGGVILAVLVAAAAIVPAGPAGAVPNAYVAYASGGFIRIGTGMTFTSDGRLFVSSGNALYELDVATGVATQRATFAAGVTGLAARCIDTAGTNQIFGIAPGASNLYRVDPQGAPPYTPITVGPVGGVLNSTKLGFDAGGTLWGLNVTSGTIMTLSTTTGAGTFTGSTVGGQGFGLAIAPTVCPASPPTTTTPSSAAASGLLVTPRFAG